MKVTSVAAICLGFSLVFSEAQAMPPRYCEDALVSRADYEGESSHSWRQASSLSVEERLYREFLYQCTAYLADHLRWPAADQLPQIFAAAKLNLQTGNETLEEELDALSLETIEPKLKNATEQLRQWFPNRYFYIRRKIASSFIRAVRQTDLEKRFRTPPTTPSDELFFFAAVKGKTNGGPKILLDYVRGQFDLEYFLDLYRPSRSHTGRQGPFSQPLIFPGSLSEIEKAARFDAPFAFNNYVDTRNTVTPQRAQQTALAIEQSQGFIAVSWTTGKPVAQDFLDALIHYAEEHDFVIVVGVTQQNYEGLPAVFFEHPRIHILTHSLENSSLKISVEPINPDIENPLSEVKKAGRYQAGQNVLVFHPHLMLESLPTGSNSLGPVMAMSSGSINEPFGSFSSAAQGRRKESNRVFHKTKAWIFEKGDGLSSFDPDGSQNIWHPRPLSYYDDRNYNGTSGFIDRSVAYQFNYNSGERVFERVDVEPEVLYLGDPHDPVTDPAFVKSLVDDLDLSPNVELAFHGGDTFDFGAISHWSMDKMVEMNLKYQRGDVSALQQVNGVIQMINALLQRYPNARYRQIVGNHDEWLNRLLDRTPDMQRVLNGDFLDELNFAVKTLKMNIWEYIFKHREALLKNLLASHPDKRAEILRRVLPIYAPDRIDILDRGAFLQIGPEHRKNDVARHGDRSTYGQKISTLKSHAKAMPPGGGVTGHTHRLGIYSEVMDPGAMAPIESDYGKGYDSAAGQAVAAIYPNGTKQLWIFNRRANSFHQRDPRSVLPPERFFGHDRFRVLPHDNQRIDQDEALSAIRAEFKRLRELVSPPTKP